MVHRATECSHLELAIRNTIDIDVADLLFDLVFCTSMTTPNQKHSPQKRGLCHLHVLAKLARVLYFFVFFGLLVS